MKKAVKIIIGISFIFYLLALIIVLFIDSRGTGYGMPFVAYLRFSVNIIPFKTIVTYIKAIFDGSMNLNIPIRNLGGNFILFLPMGIYLPFLIKRLDSFKRFAISMIILLLSVELIQLITRRGSFDIDDLILNLFGALLGFIVWRTKLFQKLIN